MKKRSIFLITCLTGEFVLSIVLIYSAMYVLVFNLTLRVSGPSMMPTLKQGDFVIVETGVSPDDVFAAYGTGDIIVFYNPHLPDEFVVHRAVEKYESGGTWYFTTKGDNNHRLDDWNGGVSESNLVGKVKHVNPLPVLIYQTFLPLAIVLVLSSIVFYVVLEHPEKLHVRKQEELTSIPKPSECAHFLRRLKVDRHMYTE